MTAHLIKSSEVSPELFTQVVSLLQAMNGLVFTIKDYCCILGNDSSESLRYVSFYRHFTSGKDLKETTVVAKGV